MPSETNLATTAVMSPDILAVYMMDELLDRADKDLVFWPLCEKSTLPEGNGKTVQFTRYERLPLPEAPLEEAVSPLATPITLSTVEAVLDQWGAIVSMSDVVQLVIKHPIVQQARELLSLQHNELVDREVQVVAMGATGVYFGGNVASRAALVAANVIATDDVRRVVATLRQLGAPPRRGGMYDGIVDPYVEADISKDPTFQTASSYSQIGTLKDFEIGRWMGVEWKRSNNIPIISLMSAAWYTIPLAGSTGAIAGANLFAGTSHVRVVVTRIDPQTGFETAISSEQDVTNASPFSVSVTIASGAPTGTYKVYSTLQNGTTGTATLQVRIRHTAGSSTDQIFLVASGAPSTGSAYVAVGSGPVAPPTPPGTINVHISYIMGRGYLGATNLSGLKTYVTPATTSDSDPLAQRTKAGWKQMFKALVLNPDFGRRIESSSAFN
jgi:N4-gp56 family major capsid protein